MSGDLKVGRLKFSPLAVGTQRILRSTDPAMATAFNQAVAAIRELQQAVDELQKRVLELETLTRLHASERSESEGGTGGTLRE